MALEASVLTVRVQSEGISDATKALSDLAKAGENAEKKTSNIGSGAKASAKAQVDAAQQAASAYNAIIDMMTEKSNTFYQNKVMQAFLASQQEIFDGMALADKIMAVIRQSQADRAALREKEHQDILEKQQKQMDAAVAASEKQLAIQYEAWKKQQQMEVSAQEKGDALNQAGQRAIEYKKIQDAAKALADETKRLAAEEAKLRAIQENRQYQEYIAKGKAAAAVAREQAEALAAQQKAEAQAKAEGEAFVAVLKRQAETVGMTTKEFREYNAEQLRMRAASMGVSQQVEGYINTIKSAKGPHESFNLLTAGSARELMVLGHELSQGQFTRFYGSLIVLAERINFLPSLLEKGAAAASSLGVSFGLLATGVAVVVAAIATLTVAIFKGASEQKQFNNALILTGNYAGVTGDSLNKMAVDIGRSAGSIGDAKKVVLQLAESGRFTAEQIAFIAPAITEVAHITGKSTSDMVQQFENLATLAVTSTRRSTDQISQHVLKLNDQYHFLTASQFEQISMLEKQGEAQASINMAEEAYAAKLKSRAEEIKGNLGTIQTVWMDIKEAAGSAWDAMLGIGKKVTPQDTIDRLKGILETMDSRPAWFSGRDQGGGAQKQFDESRMRIVQALTAAVIEKNNADAEAINKGKEQQAQTAGMHAIARTMSVERQVSKESALAQALAEQKVNDELAKRAIAIDKLSSDEKIRSDAEKAEARFTDEAIAKRNKLITDYYTKKGPKPHTEGMSGLDKEINEINEQYEVQKRAMDNQIKLIDFKNKYDLMSDEDAQSQKEDVLNKELALEKEHLEKAIAEIDNFHSKDVRLMNDAASKKANIQKQLNKVMSDIQLKQDQNALVPDVNFAAEQVKQQKEQDNILKQIEKQTAAVQAQVTAYNNLPEAVKAVGVRQKEMASEIEQAKIDALQAERDSLQSNDLIEQAMNSRRISQIDAEIAARRKLKTLDVAKEGNDAANNAALGRSAALTKVATEQIRMWKDIGSEIEKSLKNAFGASGEAAGKMFRAFAEGQSDAISLTDKARVISENKSLSETEKEQQLNDIRIQGAQNQVGMYGNMADAASLFFEKGSTGYQAMMKAAQMLHTAEVALSVIKGVNAVLTQGSGDPYSAFARMAAMAAIVAGLGVAISGSFGGGGPMTSANQQKVQGTGTVLGSPTIVDGVDVKLVGAKSDSIANSLKIAEKNSGLGLVVQNDMLMALKKLDSSISSFASLAVSRYDLSNPDMDLNSNNGLSKTLMSWAAGGVVVGSLLAKIPVLGNLFGKVGTAVFGGKQTLDDSGISVGKTSLGAVASGSLTAQSYTNITTSGGWFKSDKHDTQTQSLGEEFNAQITKVVLSMQDTLKVAANGLGMGGDAFNEKLKSFVVDIGNISFKGMTGDEIQKTLQNVFSKLGDEMAQFAFSDLQKYQKIGEGLMETVVRVANDLQQVEDVFDSLSKTIPKGAEAIATSEQLISKFGSVDSLTKGVKSYIDAIYSDEEKLAPVAKSVNDAFAKLGLSGIKTKEQFKQVVDSIDLTTSAGQELFVAMMNAAPAFSRMTDAAKKAAEDLSNNLLADVDLAFNALSNNISKQKDEISKAADAAKETAQKQLDAAKDTQSAIQTVFDSISSALKNTVDDSAAVTKAKRQEAQAYIAVAVASASAGNDVSKMGGLQDALDSLSNPSKDMYSSYQDYAFDQAKTNVSLTKLQSATKGQLDYAKLTVDRLNDTITAIEDQKNSQLESLDNILTSAQDQIDVLKGQSYSLLSIDQGIAALNNAIQRASGNTTIAGNSAVVSAYQSSLGRTPDAAGLKYWNDQISNGTSVSDVTKAISGSSEAAIEKLYQTLLHRSADSGGMKFFLDALAHGSTLNDVTNSLKNSAEYKNLPSFAVGTNNLPEDMIAQLHKGERIVPAADNAELQRKLDKADENSATSAEVSAKLDQLISIVSAGDISNVNITRELVRIIKRWDADGQPETRDVTT
jgi:phage-related minor tail protein